MEASKKLILLILMVIPLVSFTQIQIHKQVVGNGATSTSSVQVKLNGTAGQVLIGTVSSNLQMLRAGFWEQISSELTALEELANYSVSDFSLDQNYPNPSSHQTWIPFSITERANVKLDLLNLNGQKIKTILNKVLIEGTYRLNLNTSSLPDGIFIYELRIKEHKMQRKLVVAR